MLYLFQGDWAITTQSTWLIRLDGEWGVDQEWSSRTVEARAWTRLFAVQLGTLRNRQIKGSKSENQRATLPKNNL
ncbi:uncharacterized protein YALI1_C10133g [Yarrowia lipolytica]|uniref:Uncharacterized protein n=1 Tax=Yarrowia lipolytica TaxID=4952 RepID=A0A1D8NA24_YARLL|nr:hypothetical protein YALI1_C10133g [Yarrowia lipolytica]